MIGRWCGPVALALALACAPALRPPAPAPQAGAAAAESGQAASELLREAEGHLARRAQPGEAREAEVRFLAAGEVDPRAAAAPYGAIQAKIWRLDHEGGVDRGALVASAVEAGQRCLAQAGPDPRCDYGLALALGVQARERRATALDGLKRMVEHLRRAAVADPGLDDAGPDRVLALVLVRAPGWPLGPGDAEEGLAHARSAVARAPGHPPNQLALAEALHATGAGDEARAAARRAVELARALPEEPAASAWIAEGEKLAAETTTERATPGG